MLCLLKEMKILKVKAVINNKKIEKLIKDQNIDSNFKDWMNVLASMYKNYYQIRMDEVNHIEKEVIINYILKKVILIWLIMKKQII